MAIRVALNHRTQYTFDRFVTLSPHLIRLSPAPHARTPILSRSLKISPATHFINWQQDPYSNYLARVVFPEKAKGLTIEADIIVEMSVINPFDFFVEDAAAEFPFAYDAGLRKELAPFLETEEHGPQFDAYLKSISREKQRTISFVVGLNQQLSRDIKYLIRLETGVQSCEETLTKLSGSCRDSAWLQVQLLRQMGLAARFVSGYLIQLAPDVKSLDGPSGAEKDFTDLHAWTEVYLPGAGWVGLDPTSGLLAGEGHIPLACTAEPSSASPVTGFVDECETKFEFSMSIKRIHEDPRQTKPYTEEQWGAIDTLGRHIDEKLHRLDVRLSMGGEPTFVAVDSPDDPEWNTDALGKRKRELAQLLLIRLYKKWAPGGMLHHGQGKWYPGEVLPRWAFGCYWRKDGEPLWRNIELIDDGATNPGYTHADAMHFIRTLARRLQLDPKFGTPGYEDTWHYLVKEQQLPVDVDPLKAKLEDPLERRRLARLLDNGLGAVVGYALPLKRAYVAGKLSWLSGEMRLRRGNLFLIPGDSPMGFRLPLDSFPIAGSAENQILELDPVQPKPDLPRYSELQQGLYSGPAENFRARTEIHEQPFDVPAVVSGSGVLHSGAIRTTLCVEARGGHLYVFMPPQQYLEDYLALIAAIEDTAEREHKRIFIEGYTPPPDVRLNVFKVTPDPGVIEVNIHAQTSWSGLEQVTRELYEEARLTRLGTEKFMIDGRHTGTGGGNHITVGGLTPADSPLLRRPDLLRSLLTYWQNHPALSFMFSGLFVGPTSQAPRIDEARNDSLYELELAFERMPEKGNCPLWLIDRLLRNLLIDSSGNTHRCEFSIDKLYSPEGSSGRLGLLEMRAFEMPPHYRMSLVQQLLLRGLIAKFWERPLRQKLVRWGTQLHDRYMLPYFVEQDFNDVTADLRAAGMPFQDAWFTPHLEFRFPHYGEFVQNSVRVELRQAIEPWHVLGEEAGGGGTVRYVDSSIERLQVKVDGMIEGRHAVTCNGRTVPLHPTGRKGEAVAGVRYRAWRPPNCLHPTIGVHAPLTIELIDTWNKHSLGGCQYHVSHPGGLSHEKLPVNAYEAEGRRLARFAKTGHTPGRMIPPPVEINPEFPFTLDLRKMAKA